MSQAGVDRAAKEERDELAPLQSIEWHPNPTSRDRDTEYQICREQSGYESHFTTGRSSAKAREFC